MGKNPEKMHNSTNTMLNWSSSVRDATDYMPFDLAQRRNCNTVTVDLHFAQTSGACAANWKLFAVHVLDRLSHLWELQHWPRREVRDEITNEQSQLRKQVSSKATATLTLSVALPRGPAVINEVLDHENTIFQTAWMEYLQISIFCLWRNLLKR